MSTTRAGGNVAKPRVAVIGSGVVGLTCAHELSDNAAVTVFHDSDLMDTTSAIATAIWHVFLVDQNDTQHLRWAQQTMNALVALQNSTPAAGLELVHGVQIYRTSPEGIPAWADIAISFEMIPTETMQSKYPGARFGYEVTAPAANMKKYLPWIHSACVQRGVTFIRTHISSFQELDEYDWVVNCTGIKATELTEDVQLHAVRGHYLVLEPDKRSPTQYFGDEERPDGMAYVIPRDGELIVGGTAQPYATELIFDIDEIAMLERANEFCEGDISGLQVTRRVVGLRPCRTSERVRFGIDPDLPKVIHNYGHGGAGFSLAWGCATDVVDIVNRN